MKAHIRQLLEEALPIVNFDSDFLFGELDSLGITCIMLILTEEYKINLDAQDVTPKNFRSLDSIVAMVETKLQEKV